MHEVLALFHEMTEYSDQQLASMASAGMADAFVELTARYMGLIRAKAAPLRSYAMEADDLCQEGLLGLLNAAYTYAPKNKASFKTYAGVCISNRMITACRAAVRQKHIPLNNSVSLNDECDNHSLGTSFASSQVADPETLLIERENFKIVRERISKTLSKMEQKVLSLYLGGCSYAEIAGELNITAKAVDNAIQRIRHKLKKPF